MNLGVDKNEFSSKNIINWSKQLTLSFFVRHHRGLILISLQVLITFPLVDVINKRMKDNILRSQ